MPALLPSERATMVALVQHGRQRGRPTVPDGVGVRSQAHVSAALVVPVFALN